MKLYVGVTDNERPRGVWLLFLNNLYALLQESRIDERRPRLYPFDSAQGRHPFGSAQGRQLRNQVPGDGTRNLMTNEPLGLYEPLIDFRISSSWDDVLLMGLLNVGGGNPC